jgi:TRAP-type C4-dicarboxylate transport system permease small subunit
MSRINAFLERLLAPICALLMAALTLTVLWQVTSRLANRISVAMDWPIWVRPATWTEELASFLLSWTALLGAAYALRRGEHIGLDLLYKGFDARWKRVADAATRAAVALFALAMIIGGTGLVAATLELDQRTPALGWPMGWVYGSVPLAGALMFLFAIERVYTQEAAGDIV